MTTTMNPPATRPALPKPTEIKTFLDEYVIGQDETKKKLAVAVYQHYKRIEMLKRRGEVEVQKANIMLIGPTGTGKSSVLQSSIAEYPKAVLAPPVSVCMFDSGALQSAVLDALSAALASAQVGQAKWRDLGKRLQHATREAAVEVGKGLAKAVVEEVVKE